MRLVKAAKTSPHAKFYSLSTATDYSWFGLNWVDNGESFFSWWERSFLVLILDKVFFIILTFFDKLSALNIKVFTIKCKSNKNLNIGYFDGEVWVVAPIFTLYSKFKSENKSHSNVCRIK